MLLGVNAVIVIPRGQCRRTGFGHSAQARVGGCSIKTPSGEEMLGLMEG